MAGKPFRDPLVDNHTTYVNGGNQTMVTDPLLTAREAAALLCEHRIKTHEKTLKSYAQSGDIRAQRDRRPGT